MFKISNNIGVTLTWNVRGNSTTRDNNVSGWFSLSLYHHVIAKTGDTHAG